MKASPAHLHAGILEGRIFLDRWLKNCLILFLLVLPFQGLPYTLLKADSFDSVFLKLVSYSDEIVFLISSVFVVVFILAAAGNMPSLPFHKFFAIFVVAALLSMLINQVPLLQGLFGLYDVVKNIMVIYLFSLLRFSREELLEVISKLRYVGMLLAVGGIIAEGLALIWQIGIGYFVAEEQRLGVYRVISLTGFGAWNHLGIYMSLLFFLTAVTMQASWNKGVQLGYMLFVIFLTISRQAWISFGIVACLLGRKLIPVGMVVLAAAVVLLLFTDPLEYSPMHYRFFTFQKSLEILQKHPLLGIGPGMFGGLASVLFESPVYKDWPDEFRSMVSVVHNIDQFWPWVWGEFGGVGLLAYISIWGSLFIFLKKIRTFHEAGNDELMKDIGNVLSYFMIALIVMGFASGLNVAFVSFTYFALVGMYISSYHIKKNASIVGQ